MEAKKTPGTRSGQAPVEVQKGRGGSKKKGPEESGKRRKMGSGVSDQYTGTLGEASGL
jgi:hypothetical protein